MDYIIGTKEQIRILNNCTRLADEAMHMYKLKSIQTACFLAITSIEESAKLYEILSKINVNEPIKEDFVRRLRCGNKKYRSHLYRQLRAIYSAFVLCAGQSHPEKYLGKKNIQRIKDLARSGELLNIRNNCLYVDFRNRKICLPEETVKKRDAFYIVASSLEIIADLCAFACSLRNITAKPENKKRFAPEFAAIMKKYLRKSESFSKQIVKNKRLLGW